MQMQGSLPVIDYDAYQNEEDFAEALEKCPRESLIFVGKPSPSDLAKVADQQLPKRIEADFQTTVDRTDWWG
jgi:Na+-translocating ferredoxin:NAD+ oxidoreductase subunit B